MLRLTQDEPAALDLARQLAEPGELLLLNTERDAIEAWLQRAGGTPLLLQ